MRTVTFALSGLLLSAGAFAQESGSVFDELFSNGQQAAPDAAEADETPDLLSGEDWALQESAPQGVPETVVLRALEKVTARFTDLTVPMNESVRFGTLEITPRTCNKRPPEETPETTAFLEIYDFGWEAAEPFFDLPDEEVGLVAPEDAPIAVAAPVGDSEADAPAAAVEAPLATEGAAEAPAEVQPVAFDSAPDDASKERLFSGWMFASSPGLNPLEHAVYDVWVIDCNMAAPESAEGPAE